MIRRVKVALVTNPAPCAVIRKHVVTDRAQRYRANQPGCQPEGPRLCAYCGGKTGGVMVHHIDGDETNTVRRNLAWACRSCNNAIAARMVAAGRGRRTRQYNPPGGAQNLAQWVIAVSVLRGESDQMSLADARALVRETPAGRRSDFAREIWSRRRRRGSDRWSSSVPF